MRSVALAFLMMACFLSPSAVGAGKPVAEATEADEAAAREAYNVGKENYDAGQREAALAAFRKSYDIVASPNSHLMIARVLDEMGRAVEAFQAMQATMREAEAASRSGAELAAKYKKTLDTATALTAELRQKVGFVTLELEGEAALPEGATISVGGRQIRDITASVVVQPGVVRVILETPNGRRAVTTEVPPGGEARVSLEVPLAKSALPEPMPTPETGGGVSVPHALGYTAAAIGAAGFIVFGVFGGLTVSAFDDLEEGCPNKRCTADKRADIDDGKTFQVAANVGLNVGVAGAVASVALLLFASAESDVAFVRPTRDGLAIGGTF